MRCDCIFYEAEAIGATKEHIQWEYYCRVRDLYNDDMVCENCESYDNGEEEERSK